MLPLRHFLLLGISLSVHSLSLSSLYGLPPPPALQSLPLPVKLAGGLFLFQTSIKKRDKILSKKILSQAQQLLRNDPLISMELGTGLEAGGVFSSNSSILIDKDGSVHQLVMEFQINGGNSWAQCRCHGFQRGIDDDNGQVEIVSLGVSNMDGALTGGWADVLLPKKFEAD